MPSSPRSLIYKRLHRLSRVRSSLPLLPVPHALSTSNISHSLNLRSLALSLNSLAFSRLQVPSLSPSLGPLGWVRNMVLGDVRPANIQKNIYLPKLRQIFDSFSEKYYFYSTVDAPATTQPHPAYGQSASAGIRQPQTWRPTHTSRHHINTAVTQLAEDYIKRPQTFEWHNVTRHPERRPQNMQSGMREA